MTKQINTKNKKRNSITVGKIKMTILHFILIGIVMIWTYPFIWMITASFKTGDEFFKNKLALIPKNPTWDNIIRVWTMENFSTYFLNTFIITFSVVIIVLVTTALSGYVFGRYEFIGRKAILLIFLSSISIPRVSTMIPLYEIIRGMGLLGTKTGVILAIAGGGHVIFVLLFMSYFSQLPNELEEAARIDGCGFFRIFKSVMFPLAKPIATTVIIMETVWTWNEFLRPLVLTLNNPSARTLAVGLYAFRGENTVDWTGIAAGGTIAIVPVVIMYIALQKYFVEGVAGAVKS